MRHLSDVERLVVGGYKAGASVEEIARRTGCTPMLVRATLGRVGLTPRPRGRVWPYDAATESAVATEYAAGVNMAELIARYGGSNRTIRYVLEHRGVAVRSRGRRPRAGEAVPVAA